MDFYDIWAKIIKEIFEDKKGILKDLNSYSKIVSLKDEILRIRIFRSYLEKPLELEINKIKKLFVKNTNKKIKKIYLNNKIFSFTNDSDTTQKTLDVESIISFKNPLIEESTKEINTKLFFDNKVFILSLYNKLLFNGKNLEIKKSHFSCKKIKKYLIFTSIFIFPIFLFLPLFKYKKTELLKLKKEADELVQLKYEPIDDEGKYFLDYLNNYLNNL